MTCTAATLRDVTACDRRAVVRAGGRRIICRVAAVSLGTVTVAAAAAGVVMVSAAWIVAGRFATNPDLRSAAPAALQSAVLPQPYSRLADAADVSDLTGSIPVADRAPSRSALARDGAERVTTQASLGPRQVTMFDDDFRAVAALPPPPGALQVMPDRLAVKGDRQPRRGDRLAVRADAVPLPAQRPAERKPSQSQRQIARAPAPPAMARVAFAAPVLAFASPDSASFDLFDPEPMSVASLIAAPIDAPQLPSNPPAEPANDVPLLPPRRPAALQAQPQQIARSRTTPPTAHVDAAAPPPAPVAAPRGPATPDVVQKRLASLETPDSPLSSLGRDSHTAIYDIAAHTVYLPSGRKLEAHSGLGRRLDDPRYVDERDRGPTPPNVYDLTLREDLFHGVRAIRLNPVNDRKMFGRDGILAHTYMLGPSGQSFGCVSFKDYPEFLKAFLRGEIDRLVVVPHLQARPVHEERAGRDAASRVALNNR